MKKAIVNVNLEFELPKENMTEEEIQIFIENVELPKEYVIDSFEFVKVVEEWANKHLKGF